MCISNSMPLTVDLMQHVYYFRECKLSNNYNLVLLVKHVLQYPPFKDCMEERTKPSETRHHRHIIVHNSFLNLQAPKSRRQTLHLQKFQNMFYPSYIILKIQKLEGKQCRSIWGGSL